ncbi:MAG: hypothetical protein AAF585_03050, partial [Verrucomicrobiota bacterium]
MIANILKHRLAPVLQAEQNLRRHRITALSIGIACLIGLGLWAAHQFADFGSPLLILGWLMVSVATLIGLWSWLGSKPVDLKKVAHRIEERFPELDGRLLTAVQQETQTGEQLGYLQERVVFEAVDHSVNHTWKKRYRGAARAWARVTHAMTMVAFLIIAGMLISMRGDIQDELANLSPPENPAAAETTIEVSPGSTEVEKGTKLVVEATFGGAVPNNAAVEMVDVESGEVVDSFEMRRNLADPKFGTVVPRVTEPVKYRIAYSETTSETFDVGIYVHPELEQADVTIKPPEYTEQEDKTIKDVRKLTALEGSDLDFEFKVNKPVEAAELFGEDESIIPLEPSEEDPTILVAKFQPEKSQKYRLHLVDDADRANKAPPWFSVKLKKNLPPKLELAFPGKDSEVSALEEMTLEGKVYDDLGVKRVGATVTVSETTEEIVIAGDPLPGQKKHDFGTLLALEDYDAEPTQLVSYHFWAEDIGPDGEPRRTESDMFFAEVRHWEYLFREGQAGQQQQQQQQGQQGSQTQQLRIEQKEVINATWKVIRRATVSGIDNQLEDVGVVKEGQQIVMLNLEGVIQEAQDEQLKQILGEAREHMEEAVTLLDWVIENSDEARLSEALTAEKLAYQQLLKAESRESEVVRQQQSMSQSQQQQQQQNQRQLMQLELKQEDQRYETENQAEQEQQAGTEQEENLQILARLKELARRQEAIADKIKELETALQDAETEEEKEELERQLERLREEQEELLRDLDSLAERMESEQNQERMAEEREQLAETREEVQQANEQLKDGELAEAANSATRAERELNEIQEE